MIAPQPETSQIIFLQVVKVLTLLESVSRVEFVTSATCRDLPGDALGVVPPPQLHPLLDRRGVTLPIQHSAPTRHRLGRRQIGASTWISSHSRPLHLGSASCGLPKAPRSPYCYLPTTPPAGRASHLESQLMAIRYGKTAPPDPLRLPRPTWRPPTTQNRRPVQLPPPPPRIDSALMTDQSQQTTAPDLEHEGQGTQ